MNTDKQDIDSDADCISLQTYVEGYCTKSMSNRQDLCVHMKMKNLGYIYLENREARIQESVVRTCNMNLKHSSREVAFIPTDDNKPRLSKPLLLIQQETNGQTDSDNIP
jgi:hypothetical protein